MNFFKRTVSFLKSSKKRSNETMNRDPINPFILQNCIVTKSSASYQDISNNNREVVLVEHPRDERGLQELAEKLGEPHLILWMHGKPAAFVHPTVSSFTTPEGEELIDAEDPEEREEPLDE